MDMDLDYERFKERLVEELKRILAPGVGVEVGTAMRTNSKRTDTISIREVYGGEGVFAPVFRLHMLYHRYEQGDGIEAIARQMVLRHMKDGIMEGDIGRGLLDDFGAAGGRMFYKLVNTERNREMLGGLVHREWEDLSFVYCLLVRKDRERIASIPVSRGLMERWGVGEQDIREAAAGNTARLFPARLRSLPEMIRELLGRKEGPGDIGDCLLEDGEADGTSILTNDCGIGGFGAAFYDGCLRGIAEREGQDLYILPSSVHESLICTKGSADPEELGRIVREVNRMECMEEDFLSDNIYLYEREKDRLVTA